MMMALNNKVIDRLAMEYIWDYDEYVNYPSEYNSKIITYWKEDFNNIKNGDKQSIYNKMSEMLKSYVEMEYYEKAAIVRDALKNIQV
jgi:hypothetical protein